MILDIWILDLHFTLIMKAKLNNLKTYLIAFSLVLAIIAGTWLYVGSLMENLNKIKPDKGSAFSLSSPKTYDLPLLIRLADFAFSISPLGASAAQASAEGNVIKYLNAYPNTDIVQTRYFNKIKEDIILKSPGHPEIFEYQIDLAPYDYLKDEEGNLIFYEKGHANDEAYRRFAIPAPFMIDADGKKSSTAEVSFELKDDGILTLIPSDGWLKQAKYPVILDPTVEITVLNVHSSPDQGENWIVNFTTQGTADLKIIPNDQATIDDDEFVSLSCNGETRTPQILEGDVIFYPNWQCSATATVIHYTKKAGNHILRFEFGGQVAYAYNQAASTIVFRSEKLPPCNADIACGSYCTFGGLVYGTVLAEDGECWMDRNLGASRVATAYNDDQSYGYYYQWGRGSDGHQVVSPQMSSTTPVNSSTDTPGHNLFILEPDSPYDWRDPQNDNLWGDANKTNNPCPTGWHVPTGGATGEWDAVIDALGLTGCSTNCLVRIATSTLKISATGWRQNNGVFAGRNTGGYHWSSSPNLTSAYHLISTDSSIVDPAVAVNRASGLPVRCIKDDASSGTIMSGPATSGAVKPIVFRSEKLPPCNADIACGSSCTFGGIVYGSVLAEDGECWMDRNLGAERVATAYNDDKSYGYYYQWGRGSDGHQIVSPRMSGTTSTNSSTDVPGHSLFITESSSPYDWRVPQNDNLWGDVNKTNNPCPNGWHIPLQTEWDTAMINIGMKTCTTNCLVGMATSTLKLSAAGYRVFSTGAFFDRGVYGYYWSSSPYSTNAYNLFFYSTYVNPADNSLRASGFSLRCLKDDPNSGTITSGTITSGPTKPIIFRAPVMQTCSASTACGTECSFGGLVYGSVDVSGQCFMDRNLGADRVATAYNDTFSYGYYYQWGRASDGHQIVSPQMSPVTFVGSNGDVPGHANFIATTTSPYDWRYPQNNNLWGDANKTNNPCPSGWHIPLQAEWDTAMINIGMKTCTTNCLVGMATSTLKISAAGNRRFNTGALSDRGAYGDYWSGSPYSTYAYNLDFGSTYVSPANYYSRAYGLTARCLKD